MQGKIEGRRRRGGQRIRWLDGITDSMEHEFEQTLGDGEGQESLACCNSWGHKETQLRTEQFYPCLLQHLLDIQRSDIQNCSFLKLYNSHSLGFLIYFTDLD